MNTQYMRSFVGRKPGVALTIVVLVLAMVLPAMAKDVSITITGVLDGGYDQFHMFNAGTKLRGNGGWDIKGQPFILVYTFDDSKGKLSTTNPNCANTGSGWSGAGVNSPGKAVLTINGVTYRFGEKWADAGIWKDIASHCGGSRLLIHVTESKGLMNFAPGVDVIIKPGQGSRSLSQNPDWKAPFATTNVDNQTSCFFIGHMGGDSA